MAENNKKYRFETLQLFIYIYIAQTCHIFLI